MEAANRLLRYKDFNNPKYDQEGGMEIFAPRVNSEINKINSEVGKEEGEDFSINDEIEDVEEIEAVEDVELGDETSYPDDQLVDADDPLDINVKNATPYRFHSYPYGFQATPLPMPRENPSIAPKVLTYERFVTNKNK